MGFDFHINKPWYFEMQFLNAKNYVIPFIEEVFPVEKGMKVLEIGCGEGGVLKAFIEHGCIATGVELTEEKFYHAKQFLKNDVENGTVQLFHKNIYDVDFQKEFQQYFDIIILKDVIEHIHDQEKLISLLRKILKPTGQIYFGFPPWTMPWGGHQQICKSKLLMYFPYIHLLPMNFYKKTLALFGETKDTIDSLAEIKETGISTKRFEQCVHTTNYTITNKKFYLLNPIYKYKFNLKPITQFSLITKIPILRDFITTGVFYLIKSKP